MYKNSVRYIPFIYWKRIYRIDFIVRFTSRHYQFLMADDFCCTAYINKRRSYYEITGNQARDPIAVAVHVRAKLNARRLGNTCVSVRMVTLLPISLVSLASVYFPLFQDLQIIYYSLLGLEALRPCRDSVLRGLCKIVRYERHHANHVLY